MDNQKQIEEMAKEIEEAMAKARRTLGGHSNIAMFYATRLINAGYRKIPEGAVVLNGTEAEERLIDLLVDFDEMGFCPATTVPNPDEYVREWKRKLIYAIGQLEKEKVEKFAERVKMAFYYEFDELIPSIMADKIDEIAKEFTGEDNGKSNKP